MRKLTFDTFMSWAYCLFLCYLFTLSLSANITLPFDFLIFLLNDSSRLALITILTTTHDHYALYLLS